MFFRPRGHGIGGGVGPPRWRLALRLGRWWRWWRWWRSGTMSGLGRWCSRCWPLIALGSRRCSGRRLVWWCGGRSAFRRFPSSATLFAGIKDRTEGGSERGADQRSTCSLLLFLANRRARCCSQASPGECARPGVGRATWQETGEQNGGDQATFSDGKHSADKVRPY